MHKFNIPPSMMGYGVKNARLINEAPDTETGIQKAARIKKSIKRFDKVQMIAEGNELANANIDLFR